VEPLRVIVVDDEISTCAFLEAVFSAQGHDCKAFVRAEEAEHYLAETEVDLAMVDVYLGATNGIDLVQRLRALQSGLYPVVMTAHVSVETAARSVAEGAVDYVSKPLGVEEIHAIAKRAASFRARMPRKSPDATGEDVGPSGVSSSIIGRSPKMLEVYKLIAKVSQTDVNVLITGASGTGKELVAQAIHRHSKRAHCPFTPINCGALAESILESELFGHERGAFTGADSAHKGLVEASNGGTLFLDEVTETTLSFQVKLLRVIQDQQVRRVGATKCLPVDVRILAASNRNMAALLQQEQFREDLYYRLSVVQIQVPSLDDRREDIPLLVAHFLSQFNLRSERQVSIERAAIERLQSASWPGNVRELENTINRLAIFALADRIAYSDVEAGMHRSATKADGTSCGPERLNELEREHIVRMLKQTQGNKSEAAKRLGIERKTLYKKALRYGIDLGQPMKL
jgi:DNA-binding NtrC family response regulator